MPSWRSLERTSKLLSRLKGKEEEGGGRGDAGYDELEARRLSSTYHFTSFVSFSKSIMRC